MADHERVLWEQFLLRNCSQSERTNLKKKNITTTTTTALFWNGKRQLRKLLIVWLKEE